MTDASVEARLLKGLVQTVLDADFTPAQAKIAAKALRDNKIFAPVAHLLDVLSSTSAEPEIVISPPSKKTTSGDRGISNETSQSVDLVFDTVKRRKTSKAQLFDVFQAVNRAAAPELEDQVSIREALAIFRSLATDDDWKTLISIIEGKTELDPFLRGILSR